MELTRDEAQALAKRCLRRAKYSLENQAPDHAIEYAQRAAAFADITKALGAYANGCQTKIVRFELADRPNPYVEAATAAGWIQQEVYPRKWAHPGRDYCYGSVGDVCEFEGLEVEKAA